MIVKKGWGHELFIHNDSKYCGKVLCFNAGKKCSLHYHRIKHETFYVNFGRLLCTFESNGQREVVTLVKGDIREVPPGTIHQMMALEDTELIEFSTEHFDDDSVRIEKGD